MKNPVAVRDPKALSSVQSNCSGEAPLEIYEVVMRLFDNRNRCPLGHSVHEAFGFQEPRS